MDQMSVYISVDMEGVAGLVVPADVWELGPDYQQGCYLLTCEVNAAINGAFDAGATHVLVNDGHMYMRNLILDQLDKRAEVIRGSRKLGFMMAGIEDSKFDLALFVGYHAMAGTPNGVLCHTFSDQWANLRINGDLIGEITYNAIYAGNYGCPIGLVTGDESIANEITSSIPWAEHVSVKKGMGRFVAKSISPQMAQEKIYLGAKQAIQNFQKGLLKTYSVPSPIRVELEMYSPDRADRSTYIPGVERVDALKVQFWPTSIVELNKTLMCIMILCNS